LKIENAAEDARRALKAGDLRLLGVYGFTTYVPGNPSTSPEDAGSVRSTYGVKMIEGTTDAPTSGEHEQLNENAYRYAEKYNQTILAESGRNFPVK
jgi:hypothetical protein